MIESGESGPVVMFRLDDQRHGIPVAQAERLCRMVALTPAPGTDARIGGVIDVQGEVIPVVDMRRLFGLAGREPELSDQLVLVKRSRGKCALWVDGGTRLIQPDPQAVIDPEESPARPWSAKVVLRTEEGLVYVHEVERLLGFLDSTELGLTRSESNAHS